MGLFDTKKTHVATQVMPMFDLEMMGDPVKEAIQRSLVWGSDIFDEYLNEIKHGVHTQLENAYKHAKKGAYIYGTPDLQHFGQEKLKAALKPILEGIYGPTSTIEFFLLGGLSPLFAGFDYLYNQYGYTQSTNKIASISSTVGFDCFLYDIVAHYEQENRSELRIEDSFWSGLNPRSGVTPSRKYPAKYAQPLSPPELSSINGVALEYEWIDAEGDIQLGSELIDLSGFAGQEYFQAIVRQADGNIVIWKYLIGSGTYPTLDALTHLTFSGTGEYFPFIPFRANKQNLTAVELQETPEYLSTVKLMQKMNMDYQAISDQIHANPDINDVQQAILTLAVPGDTSNQADLEYLYRFFAGFAKQFSPKDFTLAVNTQGYIPPPANTTLLRWADAGFEMRLSVMSIRGRLKIGSVTQAGKYILIKDTFTYTQSERNPGFRRNDANSEEYREVTKTAPIFRYCYQENAHVYRMIEVIGATAEYPISGKYSTEFDSDEDQFVVPVNLEYVRLMPWKTRREFYLRNLNFIFNAKVIQKLKWYETGIFKVIVSAAAFVAAVFGLVELSATLAELVAAASISAAIATAGTYLAKILLLKLLGILIVKAVGPELALLTEAIMFALMLGQSGGGAGLPSLPSVETLMAMVSGLQDAIQSELRDQFAKYNAESQSFLEDAQLKMEELEQFRKDLNLDLLDSPFTDRYKLPFSLPYETPENFYNRTIHTGNVGTLAYKSIENFVSNSLKLPDIDRDPRIEVAIYG